MKFIIAAIACLAFTSAIAGATRVQNAPAPTTEGNLGTDTTIGTGTEQGLICRGTVVCINHERWCEPNCPVGCGEPEPTGQTC